MSELHRADDRTREFTPPEHADAQRASAELFTHGLLTYLCLDTPERTDSRMRSVVRAIEAERPAATLRFPQARRWAGLAACIAVVCALVYMGMPTASTAQAMIKASAQSLRAPGDRRFEVRIAPRTSMQLPESPTGTIDTRGQSLVVMRLAPEGNPPITFGTDHQGPWVVLPDGRIDRDPRRTAWPRWATVDEQPVSPDRVDALLDELADNYTLTKTSEVDTLGGRMERISGQRKRGVGPGTPQIDVLIESSTKLIKKVELRFPEPPTRHDGARPGIGERPGSVGDRPIRLPLPPEGPQGDAPHSGILPSDRATPPGGRAGPRTGTRDDRYSETPGLNDGPPPGGPRGPRAGSGGPGGPRRPPALIELRPVDAPPLTDVWFTPQGHSTQSPEQTKPR